MKLTETERIILENTDERYEYIARDQDGTLAIFVEEPYKDEGDCMWAINEGSKVKDFALLEMFNHLFQDIKWEDKEPYKFR